jgi:hypothetical protein
MRKSNLFLIIFSLLLFLFLLSFNNASIKKQQFLDNQLSKEQNLVSNLGLTDLALFTEARYTRHLSQADIHSAFQDHPLAMEHFPSGSFVMLNY